jgi:hypothetical protein
LLFPACQDKGSFAVLLVWRSIWRSKISFISLTNSEAKYQEEPPTIAIHAPRIERHALVNTHREYVAFYVTGLR